MMKVKIKSKEWYDSNKSEDGNVYDDESFDRITIGEYLENELNEYGKQQVQEIIETHKIRELVEKWENLYDRKR